MRTDDLPEHSLQDTSQGIPDVVEAEHIRDSFDEFGEAEEPKDGKSLGGMLRENPFIKIAIVAVGIVAVVIAFVMFGGGGNDKNVSEIGAKLDEREAPGQETSQAYTDAVNEVNEQRLEQAVRTGESTIPIPTNTPDVPVVEPIVAEPPVNLEDPLADWRAADQPPPAVPVDDRPTMEEPVINSGQYVNVAPVAQGPDPAAVDALAQAMAGQMQSILQKHAITGPQIMEVTDGAKYLESLNPPADSGSGIGQAGGQPPEEVEILVPAGTIVYAQTLTEANSDVPGPVLARLSTGPLRGSKIIGTFEQSDEYLTLNFNTVVLKGVSQSVNAVAIDPQTTLPAVATEVDHRYWKRFILPAAARFVEGMGDAISQREQTNVSVNGSTVTSSQPDLDTKQELAAGFAEGTREIGEQLDDIANRTKVLVKVHAGTPVGILFLEPVTKQN